MKNKIVFAVFLLLLNSVLLNAQSIELSLNLSPSNLYGNNITTTSYSQQNVAMRENHSRSNYYNLSPEISFINNKKKGQINLRLSFTNSSYLWNTFNSPTNYTLSKSQKYYAGFEVGTAKRIKLKRLLILPEAFVGYSNMVYNKYKGSNVNETGPDPYLITYDVKEPNRHVLSLGIQSGMYYQLSSKMHLGINMRIAGNFSITRGEERYIREDVNDNLFGDENSTTRVNYTSVGQSSSMALSFRYKIR